ncbi:MAG TPA: enoyl-CoA hydratase/isomerase family protein [Burkholderiaceae bacterium]|nr:enoyl-CoA hydratase/isomerase family protein [Burkholderiaceae bacterium]
MNYQTIETQLQQGIAVIWLNRPDVRNAMNDAMLAELNDAVDAATDDDAVRVIVLAGRGTAFCAGGDLNWMKKARDMTPDEAIADSAPLANLLRKLYAGPKPTVARVQGPAYAGGMGLVAACDIAVASTEAKFCLSEVKLGLIPSMISPYVIKAIGEAPSRRYFLTGEVFDSAEAYRIGFVHDIAPPEELDATVNALLGHLVQGGPNALGECKRLVRDMVGRPVDDALVADTARRIARTRATDEAQEGIAAFFAKRKPSWVPAG